jgi:hypothetical protein
MLGFRVVNEQSRLSFKDTSTFRAEHVHDLWVKTEHARNGGGPYDERQPFDVIRSIVMAHGAQVWGNNDRSHLLRAGEEPEYCEDLYWPENREEYVKGFFCAEQRVLHY